MNGQDQNVQEIAGYRIQALIGEGRRGAVYLAEEISPKRDVAIRIVSEELAASPGFVDRLRRIQTSLERLRSSSLLPFYAVSEDKGRVSVITQYVRGLSLRELVETEGPLTESRALAMLGQVAEGLRAVHGAGLVHGRIDPRNILVDQEEPERALLTGFGLGAPIPAQPEPEQFDAVRLPWAPYAAPEQIAGQGEGPSADTYALGCVLEMAVTGRACHERASIEATLQAHLDAKQLEELPMGIGPGVRAVLESSLIPDPEDRPSDPGWMLEGSGDDERGSGDELETGSRAEGTNAIEDGTDEMMMIAQPAGEAAQQALRSAHGRIAALERELADARQDIKPRSRRKLAKAERALKAARVKAGHEIAQTRAELEAQRRRELTARGRIEELEQELEDRDSAGENERRSAAHAHQAERDELERQFSATLAEREASDRALEELVEAHEAALAELEREHLEELDELRAELGSEREERAARLEAAEAAQEALRAEHQEEREELAAGLEDLEQERDDVRAQGQEQLESLREELTGTLRERETELADVKSSLDKVNESRRSAGERIAQLTTAIEAERVNHGAALAAVKEEGVKLEQALSAEREQAESEKTDLQAALEQAQADAEELAVELERAQGELEELKAGVVELKAGLARQNEAETALRGELEDSGNQLAELERELNAARDREGEGTRRAEELRGLVDSERVANREALAELRERAEHELAEVRRRAQRDLVTSMEELKKMVADAPLRGGGGAKIETLAERLAGELRERPDGE